MGNSIFNVFNGNNQNGVNPNFGNPQINEQFNSFVQGLDENARRYPQQMAQQLINSGRMSSAQFEQYRKMANMLTGKNY